MDIVKSNFDVQYKTDFIAIDLEFTGIKTDEKTSRTDTCFQRYSKCYQVAKNYQVIQFGISQYLKTHTDSYDCYTYNFYVFPSSFKEKFNSYFKCDVSTIEFLVGCNSIDFNKWMYEGVPYFNQDQLERIKKSLMHDTIQDILDNGVKRPTEFYTIEEREQAMQDWEKIKKWILDDNSKENMFIYEKDLFPFKKFLLENYLKEFSEKKKCVYFKEHYYPDIKKRYLQLYKVTEEQHNQKVEEKQIMLEDEINSAKGFAKFWEQLTEKIQQRNIPVIGHNMYLDLLFVCNHFQSFINDNYMEYKQTLKKMFPVIYDTKILQHFSQMQTNHGLEQIYQYFQKKYSININDKNNSLHSGVAHNAGYDAYMTGACFVYFQKELEVQQYENLVKIYGHPYVAMKNNTEEDFQLLEKIYIIGYKQKKIEKNQKAAILKVFNEEYKSENNGRNFTLQISEKRLNSKNESIYILYFEKFEKDNEKHQKQIEQVLSKLNKKFKDIIDYQTYDKLIADDMKSVDKKK